MLPTPKITRKQAFNWIGIWLALVITAWFCRPLLPYHELGTAGITWEMWVSDNFWLPTLNGELVDESYPLVHWLEIFVWKIFGVSEFSIRFLAAVFSISTLFLTALAAKQLWPELPKVRANAPLILIGSLMWAVFATAHVEQVYVAFFLLLYINFLIRAWKYNPYWWFAVSFSLLLGFLVTGVSFLIYALPILLTFPFWAQKYWRMYIYSLIALIVAFLTFWTWGYWVKAQYYEMSPSLTAIMGLPRLISQINDPMPFGMTFLSLIIVLFPWVFWLPLYKNFSYVDKREAAFKFCASWLVSSLIIVLITMKTSIVPLIPIYPAFCLLIARIYFPITNRPKDVVLVSIVIALLGILLIVLSVVHIWIDDNNAIEWLSTVSPLWGIGLLVFSGMLLLFAKETRLITLALMSVALTLAFNFGVIRNARDFYDVMPASERISWYQDKGYVVANNGRYMGQYHFLGRLEDPLIVINDEIDFTRFKTLYPSGRIVVYLDSMTPRTSKIAEYYQPFRNRYLAIFAVSDLENIGSVTQKARK